MPGFDTYIKGKEDNLHDVDKKSLDMRRNDIKKTDCPIVITGETSSGKSTMINLLIGGKVLPTKITASTTKLCRIRNNKAYTILSRNKKEEILQTWRFEDLNKMSKKVKVLASTKDSGSLYLDIMMPLSIVQGNVIIVDTPGISDEEQENVASIMMDYLKNALAVVFVANVANAGGIQSDRLCRITTKLRSLMEKEMCCFNAEDTIFVLNKWDTIEDDEEKDEFFESAKTKLCTLWKEIDEKHILKLAAVKTPKTEEYKAMFDDFEKILRKVIAKNENKRTKSHFEYLNLILGRCHKHALSQLQRAKTEEEEIEKTLESLHTEIKQLDLLVQKAQDGIPNLITRFLDLTSDEFDKYLRSDDFQKAIFENEDIKACTRLTVKKRLFSCFEKTTMEWERNNIERIFLKAIEKELGNTCAAYCKTLDILKDIMDAPGAWISTIIAGLLLSLGVIGTVARGLIMTPVLGFGVTAVTFVAGYDWRQLITSHEQTLKTSFQDKLKVLSKQETRKIFKERYEVAITKKMKTLTKDTLPEKKNELEKKTNSTMKNLISQQKVVSILHEIHHAVSELIKTLNSIKCLQLH
nr:uncharacterized protein LOC111111453 isoform X2 [Crassostrea virginica]